MAKKKSSKKKVAPERANRPAPRSARSPLVFFELGRQMNSFLYWSICGLIYPSSPVLRAVEVAAADKFAMAWRAALSTPAVTGRVAVKIREATDLWRAFNTESWGTQVHPELFQRLVGNVPEPDADSSAEIQLSEMATPRVRTVESFLLDGIHSTLDRRGMQLVMLGRSADQIDRPLDMELIGRRVAQAFEMRAPHVLDIHWGGPRSEGALFRWHTSTPAMGTVDAAEYAPDVTVDRLKEALLPAPGLAEGACFPLETPSCRDEEVRRAVYIDLIDQLRRTAVAFHNSTDGLLPTEQAVRRSTVGQLLEFLTNWTAALRSSTTGLRVIVGQLESNTATYGFLDVWVNVASKIAGRRGMAPVLLRSEKAAILLETLSNRPDGAASNDELRVRLSRVDENMNTVHTAKYGLKPSLPALGLRIDTLNRRGYKLVEDQR